MISSIRPTSIKAYGFDLKGTRTQQPKSGFARDAATESREQIFDITIPSHAYYLGCRFPFGSLLICFGTAVAFCGELWSANAVEN